VDLHTHINHELPSFTIAWYGVTTPPYALLGAEKMKVGMTTILDIERNTRPTFAMFAQHLSKRFPTIVFRVFSPSDGSDKTVLPTIKAIGIAAWIKDAPLSQPDELLLAISFTEVDGVLRMIADVTWGEGQIEAEIFSEWTSPDTWAIVSPTNLDVLYNQLPTLMTSFEQALERGYLKGEL